MYAGPMATKKIDDIQPKAVMSPTEQGRWGSLPPDEQLARLRAAIQRGVGSGPSDLTMDEIWARASRPPCRRQAIGFRQKPRQIFGGHDGAWMKFYGAEHRHSVLAGRTPRAIPIGRVSCSAWA